MPPEGFVYPDEYVPASLDDWYPVHMVTGEPLSTPDSGHKRMGAEYIPKYPKGSRGFRSPESMDSVIPLGWKPTLATPVPPIRCMHVKADGARCGRWSIRGGTKCQVHSGPAAKRRAAEKVEIARLRLADMSDDAIDVLRDLIAPGTNDAIRLKAATEILDRAGVKGASDINIEVEHKFNASEELLSKLAKIRENKKQEAIEIEAEVIVEVEEDEDQSG
jgi:hypothetical protein